MTYISPSNAVKCLKLPDVFDTLIQFRQKLIAEGNVLAVWDTRRSQTDEVAKMVVLRTLFYRNFLGTALSLLNNNDLIRDSFLYYRRKYIKKAHVNPTTMAVSVFSPNVTQTRCRICNENNDYNVPLFLSSTGRYQCCYVLVLPLGSYFSHLSRQWPNITKSRNS